MNITFLVGNGFDINLGLKTRYTDFYPKYMAQKHNDVISDAIKDNYKRWANLELALGEMLKDISNDRITEFLVSKATLEEDLANYLRSEQQKINLSSTIIQDEFQKKVTNISEDFSTKHKKEFLAWRKSVTSQIRYQFISFNYTSTLDEIVDKAMQRKQFSTHNTNHQTFSDVVGGVLHIHGTLSEELILALDNVNQIANPELQKATELTNYIIKATINEELGEGKTQRAKQLIDDSEYVCIYGMSLGETDLMWWKYLVNWLNYRSTRRLVLYVHEDATSNPSGAEKLRQQDKWKNTFLKTAGVKSELADKLRKQIIVVLRSNIFTFSAIGLPATNDKELVNA